MVFEISIKLYVILTYLIIIALPTLMYHSHRDHVTVHWLNWIINYIKLVHPRPTPSTLLSNHEHIRVRPGSIAVMTTRYSTVGVRYVPFEIWAAAMTVE